MLVRSVAYFQAPNTAGLLYKSRDRVSKLRLNSSLYAARIELYM